MMTEPHEQNPDQTLDLASPSSNPLNAGSTRRSKPPRSNLGDLRPVLLKEAVGESSLVVKPTSDAMPSQSETGDRYQLSGEIARGGMGAVLRGRDVDLGRDLKPANIMVGAFGEVQVMDWGLAKVLAERGIADEERANRAHQEPADATTIRTARRAGDPARNGPRTGPCARESRRSRRGHRRVPRSPDPAS